MRGRLPVKKAKKTARMMFEKVGFCESSVRDLVDYFIQMRPRGGRHAFMRCVQSYIDSEMEYFEAKYYGYYP